MKITPVSQCHRFNWMRKIIPGIGSEVLRGIPGIDGSLGYIGDEPSQIIARQAIEQYITSTRQGGVTVIHMSLRGHQHHNVVQLAEMLNGSAPAADGIIMPRHGQLMAVETCVADCAVLGVYGRNHTGLVHAGRPEMVDGILPAFFQEWDKSEHPGWTTVVVSPCIAGEHYELGEKELNEVRGAGLGEAIVPTIWGTQGFDLKRAIEIKLMLSGVHSSNIFCSDVDVFADATYSSKRRMERNSQCVTRDCWYVLNE